jgi:hypothetical protein
MALMIAVPSWLVGGPLADARDSVAAQNRDLSLDRQEAVAVAGSCVKQNKDSYCFSSRSDVSLFNPPRRGALRKEKQLYD